MRQPQLVQLRVLLLEGRLEAAAVLVQVVALMPLLLRHAVPPFLALQTLQQQQRGRHPPPPLGTGVAAARMAPLLACRRCLSAAVQAACCRSTRPPLPLLVAVQPTRAVAMHCRCRPRLVSRRLLRSTSPRLPATAVRTALQTVGTVPAEAVPPVQWELELAAPATLLLGQRIALLLRIVTVAAHCPSWRAHQRHWPSWNVL